MENVLGVIPGNGKSQGNTGVFTLFCIDHKLCFSVIEDLHPAVKVCKTNATVLAGGFLGCKILVDLLEAAIRNATATVPDGDQKIIFHEFYCNRNVDRGLFFGFSVDNGILHKRLNADLGDQAVKGSRIDLRGKDKRISHPHLLQKYIIISIVHFLPERNHNVAFNSIPQVRGE